MNRKEQYEFIKAHKLQDEATKLARSIYGDMPKVNWTNLTNSQLESLINKYNTPKKEVPKVNIKYVKNIPCGVDEGARKAILAIAKILNLKNIERNFN